MLLRTARHAKPVAVTDTVTTNASGAWSESITPASDSLNPNAGTWTIQAHYDGDATHAASTASPCTVTVQ